jgi:hypothetical protein
MSALPTSRPQGATLETPIVAFCDKPTPNGAVFTLLHPDGHAIHVHAEGDESAESVARRMVEEMRRAAKALRKARASAGSAKRGRK